MLFKLLLEFWRQGQLEHWRVQPEDLRQHPGRVLSRQFPSVGRAFIGRKVFAFFERDGDRPAGIGIHEQVVLGQKAGEEHTVPMLVPNFFDQPVKFLRFPFGMALVTQLTSVNTQTSPKIGFFIRHVRECGCFANAQLLKRCFGGAFGHSPRRFYSALQLVPKGLFKRLHTGVLSNNHGALSKGCGKVLAGFIEPCLEVCLGLQRPTGQMDGLGRRLHHFSRLRLNLIEAG